MDNSAMTQTGQIKKLYIKETIVFAIQSIPTVDRPTLEKFLELVNATGTFGAMTHEQVLLKMQQTLRYIPGASASTLLILADLLEIQLPPAWNRSPGPVSGTATYIPTENTSPAGISAARIR